MTCVSVGIRQLFKRVSSWQASIGEVDGKVEGKGTSTSVAFFICRNLQLFFQIVFRLVTILM